MRVVPGHLGIEEVEAILQGPVTLELAQDRSRLDQTAELVATLAGSDVPTYGVNTGFGRLATVRIKAEDVERLQRNLVRSHSVGVGEPLDDAVVRLVLVLKACSLALGYSGVRPGLIETLIALVNHDVLPRVPSQGSVGASGDLAPLAHLSLVVIGEGTARVAGREVPGEEALAIAGRAPWSLGPKEGLALLNGTQVSTALALSGAVAISRLLRSAIVIGALTVDAAAGSAVPFDPRIQAVRGHAGQVRVARAYRELLAGSGIALWHSDCAKVQDPYSLRCQPQVMGAVLDALEWATHTLLTEANGVSDNPLVFADEGEVLSGGNFHAEPVAFASDLLAIVASEIGALSERRIALLIDSGMSGLPAFLARDGGLNSGFMIAQVTAASLASENKSLAHPASVDSLPTSANQEDHVSMATFAAYRLGRIVANVEHILAIEALAAAQGVELRLPLRTSERLAEVIALVRTRAEPIAEDRVLASDVGAVAELITNGAIARLCPALEVDEGRARG
jgi:histidine ammonia-lyase